MVVIVLVLGMLSFLSECPLFSSELRSKTSDKGGELVILLVGLHLKAKYIPGSIVIRAYLCRFEGGDLKSRRQQPFGCCCCWSTPEKRRHQALVSEKFTQGARALLLRGREKEEVSGATVKKKISICEILISRWYCMKQYESVTGWSDQ
ncbi:hypothetical protein R6Q59_023479 [Mikania micrantha]